MLVLQRWKRTYPVALYKHMISAPVQICSMYLFLIIGTEFASGSVDTSSLHQSPSSNTPTYEASLLSSTPSLNIRWSIYQKSTIWYLPVIVLSFLFYYSSPLFSFSLPIAHVLHPAIHLWILVFIICALVYFLGEYRRAMIYCERRVKQVELDRGCWRESMEELWVSHPQRANKQKNTRLILFIDK